MNYRVAMLLGFFSLQMAHAEVSPFDSASCAGSPMKYEQALSFIQPGSLSAIISKPTFYVRRHMCGPTGCTAWEDVRIDQNLGEASVTYQAPSKVWFELQSPYFWNGEQGVTDDVLCGLIAGSETQACSKWMRLDVRAPEGRVSLYVPLTGKVTDNCLWFSGKRMLTPYEYELAVYGDYL